MSKKSPQLRFEGFTDDWEQRRLEKYFDERSERSDKGELISVTINSGVVKAIDLDRRDNSSEDKSNYKRVEKGDIAYNSMRMWQGASGYSAYSGILSPAYTVIIPKEGVHSEFFAYMFKKHELIQIFQKNSQGLTSDTWNLKFPTLKRIKVSAPSYEEQVKIANIFNELDQLITLHQRKYDKTISIKNVMLEKLFPKDSENLPEINFLSFAITWEQRELGELATIVRGASPRPIQDPKWFDEESEIGWLRIADVTEQDGRINYLEQHISKLGQEKTRVLTEPHLLLSIAATVGKPVVNYVKTGVHDGFLIFQEPKFNREFMFQWLEMFRPKWQKYGQPGSQVNLNSDLVKNQRIVLPSEEEQEKIGTFFSQLDHLITLHQRMLLLFITLILI